jgi:hypothetical protein
MENHFKEVKLWYRLAIVMNIKIKVILINQEMETQEV